MSPADRRLWLAVQRKVAQMDPEIARRLLQAFQSLRAEFTDAEIIQAIDSGAFEAFIRDTLNDAAMDRAFRPARDAMRQSVQTGFQYVPKSLPRGGTINGTLAIRFDYLNPRIIDAIRQLETKVIQTLQADIRDTVRAYVENGLRNGVGPRVIARDLRAVIGMSPTQSANALKYEAKLIAEDRPAAQVERMVARYRKRAIALNAETNARTAALDAMKLGQHLAWQDAADKGIVDPNRLYKTWRGVLDDRERDSHLAMEGDTAPYDQPYSNGQMIPGDDEWNCRCVSVYSQRAA